MSQPYERQLERLAYGEDWDLAGFVEHTNNTRALHGHVSALISDLEESWEGEAAKRALARLRLHEKRLQETTETYDKALMEITGSSSMACGMTMGANAERKDRAESLLRSLPGFLPSWLHNAVNQGGTVEYEGTVVSKANGALEELEAKVSGKREEAAKAAVSQMGQTIHQLSYRLRSIVEQLPLTEQPGGGGGGQGGSEDDGPGGRGVDEPTYPDSIQSPDRGDGTGPVAPPGGFPDGPGIPGGLDGPSVPGIPGAPGGPGVPGGPGGGQGPDIGGPGGEPGRPGMPGPAPSDPPRIEMPQPRLPYPGVDGPTVPGTTPPPSIDIPGGPAYPDYPGGEGDTGVDSDMGGGTTNRPGSGLLPGVGAGGALAVGSKAAGGAGSLGTGPGGLFGGSGAAGAGGVGGIGGAPGAAGGAAGPSALAGRSGGLLGGVGGAGGGSGGTGAGGSGAGGTGSGGRPMGMMGAPMGGANNGKKQRGAGLGYLAPHLEDEGERGPASDISRAGSRETPEEPFFAE